VTKLNEPSAGIWTSSNLEKAGSHGFQNWKYQFRSCLVRSIVSCVVKTVCSEH